MLSNILVGATLLAGVAYAAPRPQDIDFQLAAEIPNPTYTTTLSQVTYDATKILEAAMPQITASEIEEHAAEKVKRAACQAQPTGFGPIPTPDSPSAFLSLADFPAAASAAPVPSGYSQSFQNLQAANNAYGYMGYTTLKTYDSNACAAKCNKINGCMAFNIYFERDPVVEPAAGCDNPASTTMIKCVFWGGPVTTSNANNPGQWREKFQVVIAGSNGYINNSIATPAGYTPPTALGNAAINAPYDQFGFDSYMGAAIFNDGPFNVQLCADACSKKSAYNLAHPPTDGSPVQTCQFFNTYILYVNTTANLQGQYCAMYSESWPKSYATNVGQYRGSDHYKIQFSYMFSNATNPGSASPPPAVYQASRDISYSTLQPFCSSYLGYTIPVTTTTTTTTTTPLTTTTTTTTTTVEGLATDMPGKRALSTPNVLTKYPTAILSSACSMQATPVTTTAVVITTTTATAATATTTSVVVTTATAGSSPPIACGNGAKFALQGSYNGKYAVGGQGESSRVRFIGTSPETAQLFTLTANCHLAEASGLYASFEANQDSGPTSQNVYFNSKAAIASSNWAIVYCGVDANSQLNCNVQGNTISSQYQDTWYLSNYANAAGVGNDITVTAVLVPSASPA